MRSEVAYPYVFNNNDGTTTTINAFPTRVVITEEQSYRMVDLLFALGVKTPIVGAGNEPTGAGAYTYVNSQNFPAWLDTTDITPVGAFNASDYEAIAGLNPNLIISGSPDPSLSAIAPTINVGRGTSWYLLISEIAPIFGKQAEAAQIIARFDQRAAALRSFSNGATVSELSPTGDGQTVGVFDAGYEGITNTEFSYTMEEAGFRIAPPPAGFPTGDVNFTLSDELLPQLTADYVFVYTDSASQLSDFQNVPTYKEMPAAAKGHVYGDYQYVFGAGPMGSSLALDKIAQQAFGVRTTEAVAYPGSNTNVVPIVVDMDVQASTGKACWTINAAKAGVRVRSIKIMDGSKAVLTFATNSSARAGCGTTSTGQASAFSRHPGKFTVDLVAANGAAVASSKLGLPLDTYPGV